MNFVQVLSTVESCFPYPLIGGINNANSPMWRVISLTRVHGFCRSRLLCGELFPLPVYVHFVGVVSYVESYFPYQCTCILQESSPVWRVISLTSVRAFCRSRLLCGELFPLPVYVHFVGVVSYVESYFPYQCTLILQESSPM